jgi:hypothetical protein
MLARGVYNVDMDLILNLVIVATVLFAVSALWIFGEYLRGTVGGAVEVLWFLIKKEMGDSFKVR